MTTEEILSMCKDGLDITTLDSSDMRRLLELAHDDYCFIPGGTLAEKNYYLLPKGEDYLLLKEQERNEKANDDARRAQQDAQAVIDKLKQRHHDWLVGIICALLAIITGLIVKYWSEIICFFTHSCTSE